MFKEQFIKGDYAIVYEARHHKSTEEALRVLTDSEDELCGKFNYYVISEDKTTWKGVDNAKELGYCIINIHGGGCLIHQ